MRSTLCYRAIPKSHMWLIRRLKHQLSRTHWQIASQRSSKGFCRVRRQELQRWAVPLRGGVTRCALEWIG
jgi:hypothetical protein